MNLRNLSIAVFTTAAIACGGAPKQSDETPVEGNDTGSSETFEQPEYPRVEIEYEKFVLDNGLTVVVHTDDKAPVVAVNVWYHVGSKDERPGKTGFAHLFEHLMFQGSENFQGEFFEPLEKVGATDLNGTTNNDRTNYFQTVPTSALDVALWMESDRMGHFQGAISQERLDEQRGVVQNEKRQGQNRPYGKAWEVIPPSTYPPGHPYSWTVIGSMDDLNAASLDDVKGWFSEYYGPNNAVIVLAGDITVETAKKKMEEFFGHIKPGPETAKRGAWVAPMTERKELTTFDQVPQERAYYVYNVPAYGERELEQLRVASWVLGRGKNSRLYKRLVYEEQLATNVYAWLGDGQIGSQLFLIADARPGVPLKQVEAALEDELATFLAEGPAGEELIRVKMDFFAELVSNLERVGGFGGKSDLLAEHEVYFDDPGAFERILGYVRETTPSEVAAAAKRWLGDGIFVLRVLPAGKRSSGEAGVDRTKLPSPGPTPSLDLPEFQRATLSNGVNVVLAERHTTPIVKVKAMFDVGFAYDKASKLGLTGFALDVLDEGTATKSSLELSAELERLGASVAAWSSLDESSIQLTTLTTTLAPALDLFTDITFNPAFADNEVERIRKQRLAGIKREQSQPFQNALRVMGPLLYGEDHAYGMPLTGSGTEASIASITSDDLREFHTKVVHPDRLTLLVVGDTTMAEIKPMLEERFGSWSVDAKAAEVASGNPAKSDGVTLYLLDKDNAEQSLIIAGHLIGERDGEQIDLEAMNAIFGGTFTARLNMNLREDKHWSYGARSFVFNTKGEQLFGAYASVQTDKTSESMVEIKKELEQFLGAKPPTADELQKTKDNKTRKLPGQNETVGRLLGSMTEVIRFGLPDDYWDTYVGKVNALTVADIQATAKATLKPKQVTWIIVGDLDEIEDKVRALGYGKVVVLDKDGAVVK